MYYINAAVNDGSAIASLMKYFKTADANDFSQGNLSKRINSLKTKKEGITFMDDLIKEFYDAGAAKGEAKGRNKEKLDTAKRMLALGKSLQDIELITNLPFTTIKQLQAEMLQPV